MGRLFSKRRWRTSFAPTKNVIQNTNWSIKHWGCLVEGHVHMVISEHGRERRERVRHSSLSRWIALRGTNRTVQIGWSRIIRRLVEHLELLADLSKSKIKINKIDITNYGQFQSLCQLADYQSWDLWFFEHHLLHFISQFSRACFTPSTKTTLDKVSIVFYI